MGVGVWQNPQKVISPVGCTNQYSIAVTDKGIFFESFDTIWLLSRSMQVVPVGLPVKDLLTGKTIVAALSVPRHDEVRFFLAEKQIVCFNYVEVSWHTYSIPNFQAAIMNHAAVSGNELFLIDQSLVAKEDSSLFEDIGIFYGITIITPWFQLDRVQGFQRVYKLLLLGEFVDDHDLTVEIGYDFDSTYSETKTFNQDVGDGDVELSPYQLVVYPSKQKCQAIRFRIRDVQPVKGPSAGPKLTSMLLEVGIKRGTGQKTLSLSHSN